MCKSKFFLLLFIGLAAATSSSAQWLWLDKDGRKVFSDRPPPTEILEKNVLKRPGAPASEAVLVPAPVASTPKSAASQALKPSNKEPSLEAKKKQAEAEEAAKRKAESDKNAAAKLDNCARAKQGLSTLQSGIRLFTTNAAGERAVMDDQAKAAEAKRLQDTVASDCK